MDWFLYDIGLRHERVKETNWLTNNKICVLLLDVLNICYWRSQKVEVNFSERKLEEMRMR